jgi:regulator of protease activity HflC (stomatin/prohibitin superfamily)
MKNTIFFLLMTTFLLSTQNCASLLFPYTDIPSGNVGLLYEPTKGGLQKTIYKNGRVEHSFRGHIVTYPTLLATYEEKVEVITQDELQIHVVCTVRIRPIESEVYSLHTTIGKDYYRTVVSEDFRASIRNVLSAYPINQISRKSPAIEMEIKNALNERIKGKFLEIDDTHVDDIIYSAKIQQEIEDKVTKQRQVEKLKHEYSVQQAQEEIDKMKAKRSAEIRVLEAEAAGRAQVATTKAQEEIERIKAQRESDLKIIMAESKVKEAESKVKEAEANAKAMKINSKAQSEAQKLYNENLTKEYLQLKALESPNAKYIYYPTGTNKLPAVNINQSNYQYHYEEKPAPAACESK